MTSKINNGLPNVVVVGGGGAGAPIVKGLSTALDPSKYNLILINSRPYYVHLIACIRMAVTDEGKLEDKVLIPFEHNFVKGNGTLVVGTVTAIDVNKNTGRGGEVVLASGERIPYAALILTPGRTWEGPLALPNTREDTLQWVSSWRNKFEKAESIIFAGGGAVGSEFAGEIKEFYPHKKVTIVQGDEHILNDTYPLKWRKDVERRLRLRGVELVLGDYIDEIPAPGTTLVRTRKGKELTAELVVPTRGPRPNTAFIASSLGADTLSASGYVKVNSKLQLPTYPDIYAAGDTIEWAEEKQVAKYAGHAAVVVPNVLTALPGSPPANPKEYKGGLEAIFLTIGKGGAGYLDALWGLMFGDWIVGYVKSQGLFIGKARKDMGLSD